MRVLLDTHAFLWLVTGDPKLSPKARSIFLDPENALLLSAVTGFEISVKYKLGKLALAEPPREFMEKRIENNALTPFPILVSHTYRLATLPMVHRDPFDRLLVAQALEENLPLLSSDATLSDYGVNRVW